MANTFKFGNGEWAVGKETALAYNDENNNFKPLPFSFDRASTATVVNKNGLIETVGVDEPRIDFLNNTKGHLLLEPQRRNDVSYSDDFSQWTNTGSETTDTAEAAISPDGSLNATKLQEANSSFGYHRLTQSITASSGTDYALSFFAKKGTQKYVQLLLINTSNSETASKVFDLENGTLGETIINGSATLQDAKIEDFGNGWYRCTIIAQLPTAPNTFRINLANAATGNTTNLGMVQYTGDSNGNIYIWGAQLEAGSYATSYIPTSGSAVTRSAEFCQAAGNSTVINKNQGVLFAEIAALADDLTFRQITLNDGGLNTILIGYRTNSNRIYSQLISNNISQAFISYDVADITEFHKVAVVYENNRVDLWIDGVKRATDISATMPLNLTNIDLEATNGSAQFYAKTKQIKLYNTALSDTELQALTTI